MAYLYVTMAPHQNCFHKHVKIHMLRRFCILQCACITGLGGNLAAVQASRISTHLHMGSSTNATLNDPQYHWNGICGTFWRSKIIIFRCLSNNYNN